MKNILEIYKENLRTDVNMDNVEKIEISREELDKAYEEYKKLVNNVKTDVEEIKNADDIRAGDILEIFPSFDGLEMLLYVFIEYKNNCINLLPVTKYVELTDYHTTAYISMNNKVYGIMCHFIFPFTVHREAFVNNLHKLNHRIYRIHHVSEDDKKMVKHKYNMPYIPLSELQAEFYELELNRYQNMFNKIFELDIDDEYRKFIENDNSIY